MAYLDVLARSVRNERVHGEMFVTFFPKFGFILCCAYYYYYNTMFASPIQSSSVVNIEIRGGGASSRRRSSKSSPFKAVSAFSQTQSRGKINHQSGVVAVRAQQQEQQRERQGEEEEYYDRPPAPPGPENDAMESETFSNALKAGFVVLSVLSVVAVFSLAGPVLRVMTETFPAGRGPQ